MWRPFNAGPIPLLGVLNNSVRQRAPESFPNLRGSTKLLLASDYSGSHRSARFESMTFVLTTREAFIDWDGRRRELRANSQLGTRRLAYKKLDDKVRARFLPDYLREAGQLYGIAITILVDRSIRTLFSETGNLDPGRFSSPRLREWKKGPLERLLRATTFAAWAVAGLSADGQHVRWVTDEDEIAANDDRMKDLVDVFVAILSQVLPHKLSSVGCFTTADDPDLQAEDFAGIADVVAGALSDLLAAYHSAGVELLSHVIAPPPASLPPKARAILDWLSSPGHALKRLVLAVDASGPSGELRVMEVRLHNTAG